MLQRAFLISAMFFSFTAVSFAQDDSLPLFNVAYGDATRLRLDIFLPEDHDGPAPTVMILHGGAGNKGNHVSWANHLIEQGYAVVLPNYRTPPAQYSDGFCALAWIHANAEDYGFDTEHLFVIGWSWGGGVAIEPGLIDADIDPFAEDECDHPAPEQWVSGTVLLAAVSNRWRGTGWQTATEPLSWLDGSEAPFLLIHGAEDTVIPVEDSEFLAAHLEEAGIKVELLILPDAGHQFPIRGTGRPEAWAEVDDFLAEQTITSKTEE